MNWQALLNPAIQQFICDHENEDPARLALKSLPDASWPRLQILNQIKARQKARQKLGPEWIGPNIILPTPDVIEQASSHACAQFKSSLCTSGDLLIDLTGGTGMDLWAMGQHFKALIYCEENAESCEILEHNLKILSPDKPIKALHGKAESFADTLPPSDMIFIDPMRRHDTKKGIFKLEDCAPNIIDLLPMLLPKTKQLMIKTSPMADIKHCVDTLKHVHSVYVIEYQKQCKELLLLLQQNTDNNAPDIYSIKIDDNGKKIYEIKGKAGHIADFNFSLPKKYLYEPGPALQKAQNFEALSNLHKLSASTHLFTSDTYSENFPGRTFEIIGQYAIRAKDLPFKKANLTVRNFPDTVEALRKKLKLKEGGEDYLFACTLMNGEKTLLHGRKA